jgi:acyl dehydratase
MASTLVTVTKRSRGINYGSNKVRFTSPVPAGSRIRLRQRISAVDEVPGNGVRVTSEVTVEVEGQERPALVAEIMGLRYA